MSNSLKQVIRYHVSGEESRIGRKDYWNSVFLANRTPDERRCLEYSKVFFVLALSLCIMAAVSLMS